MIAMALVNNPQLLIADEPTTALDVTIQAQILELLAALREKHRLAVLFISHDLGVVSRVAEQVAVMYAGEIVEMGPVDEIFSSARHSYTRGLISAIPTLKTDRCAAAGHGGKGRASGKCCALAGNCAGALGAGVAVKSIVRPMSPQELIHSVVTFS